MNGSHYLDIIRSHHALCECQVCQSNYDESGMEQMVQAKDEDDNEQARENQEAHEERMNEQQELNHDPYDHSEAGIRY